jgi:hypothetical protein
MINWLERAKVAISQKGQYDTAKTDEIIFSRFLSVSSVPTLVVFVKPEPLSSVLAVLSPTVLEKHDFPTTVIENPDRWCWPQSSAMNGAEIAAFADRLHKFSGKGISRSDSELLANKLVVRDRESDDRRVCLECSCFTGYSPGSWRCNNWEVSGVGFSARDAHLPLDLILQLQRCAGFTSPTQDAEPFGT